MISSLLWSLKKVTVGVEDPPEEDEYEYVVEKEEKGPVDDIKTAKVKAPPCGSAVGQKGDSRKEKIQAIGTITVLDPSLKKGIIDRLYQFDYAKFCSDNVTFEPESKVEFEAERSRRNPQWQVTKMKLYQPEVVKTCKERRTGSRKVEAKVKTIHRDSIEVEVVKDELRFIQIIKRTELDLGFQLIPGDCIQLKLEKLGSDETLSEADLTGSKILSVAPLQKKTFVGKVTKRYQQLLIDDSIYFTKDVCKSTLPLGAVVCCTAIQSEQEIGNDRVVNWRAIEVEKSSFMNYTSPDVMTDPSCDWLIDDIGKEVVDQHGELFRDKFGIIVTPKVLNFHVFPIGSSGVRVVSITNSSERTFRLQRIYFNQDASVCQFEVKSSRQEPDGGVTFLPKDEVEFQVTCRVSKLGRTTELCVFDFGQFLITRNFIIVGRSDEEERLAKDFGNILPICKHKRIDEEDIASAVTNVFRKRVHGSQAFKAPFFSLKRLPTNSVPKVMWQILRDKNEAKLKRTYPAAFEPLQFDNYKQKFAVSLWFEEMENDLLRRQYDMTNVVLTKHGLDSAVYFTFTAPGIHDIQPPVNTQDPIDVFDPENPNDVKYEGVITKIFETEVNCVFGDAFNQQYAGAPLTIQFCLGRTSYKRCHFAVKTAVDYLGEDYLFPGDKVEVKPPRIDCFEEEEVHQGIEEVAADKSEDVSNPLSIFDSPKPTAVIPIKLSSSLPTYTEQKPKRSTHTTQLGAKYESDTPSEPSCTTAKLQWFNTNLNDEQKDAVRRIIRGQARPLPYIIYGPPGTGKTVTLVEAVMQINKMDTNSRILVCAPSNSAADIIAEHLASSRQYHPGDFVRLNGFMRSGQTIMESIAPFCTDGEDLISVVANKLIVSTCTTAGQFFSLDLSIGHFTHVFVDEAGYCTEPEAMVPATLLALSKGGQLILAGDPNQLGPVLMSNVAENCGLNKSLLERLMSRKLYSRDAINFPKEKYNPLVVTKLVKNYRAHPTLLQLPSRLFYDDDLICKASFEDSYALCQDPQFRSVLVSQGVPMIFHGVQGRCCREPDSKSSFNKAEAVLVVHYVATLVKTCGLKFEDIGIITPYRKQVEKIRLALQMNFLGDDLPKVASVEEFQGGERKVIIISMVRSINEDKIDENLDKLGFIYQPKRFNVAITRAKALMIVVGNPHVLARNVCWLQLLRYAIELNAYKGCNLPIHLDQEIRRLVKHENPTMLGGGEDDTNLGNEKQLPELTFAGTEYDEEEFLEEDSFC